MRVGINTLVALPQQIGGIQTYLRELITHLVAQQDQNRYILFVAPWNRHLFPPESARVRHVVCPVPPAPLIARVAYEQTALPLLAATQRLDVFHAPANVMPLAMPCPTVLTLQDMIPFTQADQIPPLFRWYWHRSITASARRATLIATGTHSAADDICRILRVPPEKVRVTLYGGGQDLPNAPADSAQRRATLGIISPYILWVGKQYPHKNVERLIAAYETLSDLPHQLVLAGMDGWATDTLAERTAHLRSSGRIVSTGYVDTATLAALYAGAELFAFPSLHEGFGLPIIEAMRHGVPVVTSNRGALAEVAGDAAVLVTPESVDEIAAALRAVLTDSQLRTRLSNSGQHRSCSFSWTVAAASTTALYMEVLREHGPSLQRCSIP